MSFNRVILQGNLTRDPELRYTPKGVAVAKLGLAINEQWSDDSGQKQERVTFVDVDAFGKRAETIAQYFKKGKPILIEGRLRMDEWQDKQTGAKRTALKVVLDNFTFTDSPGGGKGQPSADPAAQPDAPAETHTRPDNDDVPF